MFCFQCQETLGGKGCVQGGVCGKKAATADLQDALIAVVKKIGATRPYERALGRFARRALFATITNANFDDGQIGALIDEGNALLGGASAPVPIGVLAEKDEDVRSLKEIALYGLKGCAAYLEHAAALGCEEDEYDAFLLESLAETARDLSVDAAAALVLRCGDFAVKAMELLDRANTSAFGDPTATEVKIGVGTRPGILVSGHDLRDVQELLEQLEGEGVDLYTHSETLPAHYYPGLRKYSSLFGNYGGAWHAQQKEFAAFNGPILLTTNCLVPVRPEYANRIFTTGPVGYPGVERIPDRPEGGRKDFSKIVALAKTLPPPTPLEEGSIVGGFARAQLFALSDKIVDAVKSGKIKRFVVMAGCDGRHASRSYYEELARKLPRDFVILTAGCAKYRYNKLNLGEIDGIPRVLDAGQCNDSYSLAVIALKLKEIFGLDDVNDLPISFALGWYEQKAVAVLLALFSLGFKGIRLGPTLPAFISPNVLKILVERFDVRALGSVESDLAEIVG